MKKKKGHKGLILIAVIVVILSVFLSLIEFITDWEWFREVGYTSVFFKELLTKIEMGVPVFIVVTLLIFVYLTMLRKSYFQKIASKENTNMKLLKGITWGLSAVFGLFIAVTSTQNLWYSFLQFKNSTDFGIKDPVFNLDIAFYIFKLDFLDELDELVIAAVIGFAILTALYYIIVLAVRTPDFFEEKPKEEETVEFNPNDPLGALKKKFSNGVGTRQLDRSNITELLKIASGKVALLGFIFFIMLAIDFLLSQFQLLQSHTGVVYGAGYTDIHVTLWQLRILMGFSVVSAFLFVFAMLKKKYKSLLVIPAIYLVIALGGSGISYLVQDFVVSPDELNKESLYIERNIEYTQYAYGLSDVTVKDFPADNTLTAKDIIDNAETMENIRINDFDPAQQFYNQTQSIRQYYTFFDVDNDRYMVNGEYTQTFLTAREIDESKISDTWLNQHLKYTHGYGVALSRVDKVTASGQPDVLIGNIPPESSVSEIKITRPEIYFGELTNNYVIVGTNEEEFDYPDGSSNAYTKYEGTAGIRLDFLNRIMFAMREGSLKLFTSTNISSNSKIIINRNIVSRVKRIMPYLSYEGDPYLVIDDGKLYWMMDAYTKSANYPYSEPFRGSGVNYIRNSIKVVVDAYNGDVRFYVVDDADPMALTLQKIFPVLFKNMSDMPKGLQSYVRYPNELFEIQANVYAKYHMEDTAVFYQSEDLWDIGNETYDTGVVKIEANYYIAKLPGEKEAEFFNSIPFTPKSKKNMTALLIARNDGANYGELVLYQFPKSRTIYGTEQIEAQIDQNTKISQDFSLWTSAGTKYRRGNLFVIPINTSILYVEPVYLEAQNSSIPEVKRIIVAYNDQIAYGETLSDCLVQIFGKEVLGENDDPETDDPDVDPDDPVVDPTDDTNQELINKALDAYNNAVSAQKNGDWASYGKYIDELSKYLNELASRN
ncbi:MAG: UPF0182 family protein [Clostridia bacterium]|nr:UPF0182 family protein [Clostridia bacterium]